MSKRVVDFMFDYEEQRLYMRDPVTGKLTEVWVLGMGVPAQLMFCDSKQFGKESSKPDNKRGE